MILVILITCDVYRYIFVIWNEFFFRELHWFLSLRSVQQLFAQLSVLPPTQLYSVPWYKDWSPLSYFWKSLARIFTVMYIRTVIKRTIQERNISMPSRNHFRKKYCTKVLFLRYTSLLLRERTKASYNSYDTRTCLLPILWRPFDVLNWANGNNLRVYKGHR